MKRTRAVPAIRPETTPCRIDQALQTPRARDTGVVYSSLLLSLPKSQRAAPLAHASLYAQCVPVTSPTNPVRRPALNLFVVCETLPQCNNDWLERTEKGRLVGNGSSPVFKSSAVSAKREKRRALGSEWQTVSFPDRIFEVELVIPISFEVTNVCSTGERPPL